MPQRALRPCGRPGCRNLVRNGSRCEACAIKRPSSTQRGYDAVWQKLRAQHLAAHPRCVGWWPKGTAPGHGVMEAKASHVDHVIPHRGDDALRLNPANLQSLCHGCHSRKTATVDHGFGNE